MQDLNWVDYIILAIFFFSILAGFARGFVKEAISLLTLIAAFLIAIMFANPLAATFTQNPSVQNAVNQASSSIGVNAATPVSYIMLAICFGIVFAGVVIIGAIVGSVINIAFQSGILGVGNRLLGAAFGFCRGFLINLVLIFLVQLTSFASYSGWQQSQLVSDFQPAVQWLGATVSPSLANLKDKVTSTIGNVGGAIQGATQSVTNFGK